MSLRTNELLRIYVPFVDVTDVRKTVPLPVFQIIFLRLIKMPIHIRPHSDAQEQSCSTTPTRLAATFSA